MTWVYIAAIDNGESVDDARQAARKTSKAYRRAIAQLEELTSLERYYFSVDTDRLSGLLSKKGRKRLDKVTGKAVRRTSERVLDQLTLHGEEGQRRIVDQPPLTTHHNHANPDQLSRFWHQYVSTTNEGIRYLLSGFRVVDHVLRVLGVGSVGTRCYIIFLEDRHCAPLFLQLKEAQDTVLATHGRIAQVFPHGSGVHVAENNGHGVVAAQRILQAHSDSSLGRMQGFAGEHGEHVPVDYYWRQFKDMKGSVDLSVLTIEQLTKTARV